VALVGGLLYVRGSKYRLYLQGSTRLKYHDSRAFAEDGLAVNGGHTLFTSGEERDLASRIFHQVHLDRCIPILAVLPQSTANTNERCSAE